MPMSPVQQTLRKLQSRRYTTFLCIFVNVAPTPNSLDDISPSMKHHLTDDLFRATQLDHRFSEELVADESIVDAVIFLLSTPFLKLILNFVVFFSVPFFMTAFAIDFSHIPCWNCLRLSPFLVHCCFVSGIFIAWNIGMNCDATLNSVFSQQCALHEPFSKLICVLCLVDSCASTIPLNLVSRILACETALLHCNCLWCLQLLLFYKKNIVFVLRHSDQWNTFLSIF